MLPIPFHEWMALEDDAARRHFLLDRVVVCLGKGAQARATAR